MINVCHFGLKKQCMWVPYGKEQIHSAAFYIINNCSTTQYGKKNGSLNSQNPLLTLHMVTSDHILPTKEPKNIIQKNLRD
jgi:hypothetical protein